MKQIFPKEILENTVEVYRFKHRVKSKIIYGIVLIAVISIAAGLPFVFLDIYSSAQGILKPEKERNQIVSLYSGKIKQVAIKENQSVLVGDTLLVIDNSINKEKIKLLSTQVKEHTLFAHDVNYLATTKSLVQDSLQSFLYQTQYLQYAQKLHELQTRFTKTKTDFYRQRKLYRKEVIAKVEFENAKYNLDLAASAFNHFKKQQRNQWQAELTQQKATIEELKSKLQQLVKEQGNYTITAAISGTVQNFIGVETGNFVTAGSVIAEISPNTELIAECYVSPSDIGLLKINSKVKFQIDAFNYNQWGMATGKIIDIQKDISIINDRPLFKVRCTLNQKQLHLKNGFTGNLKKGMTLRARFFIANRSAYQLLYDKVDDWFNPSK